MWKYCWRGFIWMVTKFCLKNTTKRVSYELCLRLKSGPHLAEIYSERRTWVNTNCAYPPCIPYFTFIDGNLVSTVKKSDILSIPTTGARVNNLINICCRCKMVKSFRITQSICVLGLLALGSKGKSASRLTDLFVTRDLGSRLGSPSLTVCFKRRVKYSSFRGSVLFLRWL